MGEDLTNLTRALLVHATMGTKANQFASQSNGASRGDCAESTEASAIALVTRNGPQEDAGADAEMSFVVPDRPRLRFWIRGITGTIQLLLLVATITNIIAVVQWRSTVEDGSNLALVQQLRCVARSF